MEEETTRVVIVGNTQKTITATMTKKMYSWSKYGGSNLGLVQSNKTPDWVCQACGEQQAIELPSFMFEFVPREFIRICSKCQFEKVRNEIDQFEELISLVRRV